MKLVNRIISAALSLLVGSTALTSVEVASTSLAADYSMNTGNAVVENLDRGISAINTGSGMMVSWRFLADDSDSSVFKLYRDNTLIYTSNSGEATCYLDASGSSTSVYKVETLVAGKVISSDTCTHESANNYLSVKLDKPTGQTSGVTYSPNDCTVGDVDGDGEYELFVKWDPSNSKDNSQKGYTDKVFIDCYKLNGTKLWRIDLGVNIRAGAHYTQMLVADFDSDGYAELTCKTADGTVDGTGVTIGDGSKDYRNSNGYILTGNEYYTLFDGATGKALDTVNYNPGRGTVKNWGDSYGNRVDRFLGSVVYLDGVHPSAVTVRGYYTRMTACAYDVVNKKLVQRWLFDTGNSSSVAGYGDGNHNCMPADVDADGKEELVMGSCCIDDNGTILWNYNKGHGDAMHVGDFLPDREGLEVWICHEDSPYGVSLLDGKTGKAIFHVDGDSDTGRCCADNVWTENAGAEFWGLGNTVYNGSGTALSCNRPAINFLSYWDGDLEREILDGYTDSTAKITKMGTNGKLTQLMETTGFYTCNTTKGTPCLSADILGDWREEVLVRASDGNSIGIFCTTYSTNYRITTLMHDVQYRTQVSAQNSGYNQPPHPSFYLASEKSLPSRPNVSVLNSGTKKASVVAATLKEGGVYTIKNQNSGLYLALDSVEDGGNVVQKASTSPTSDMQWKVFSGGNGYYYIRSQAGTQSLVLNVAGKSAANGTNINAYTYNQASDNKLFKFVQNDDGSYLMLTKVSSDASGVEVINAYTTDGANVQEYELNGATCQNWILEEVTDTGCEMDTSKIYMFKNVNSGLYMNVTGGATTAGTNIQQWGADLTSPQSYNSFTLKAFSGGGNYYYIMSQLGNGSSYCLKPETSTSAGNISLSDYTTKDSSQLFRFIKNLDGTYSIYTHASKESCVVEIADASTSSGGNVQQFTPNGATCQLWNADVAGTITTTVATTVAETTTTTTTTTAKAYATLKEGTYLIKNSNSKYYLASESDENGANLKQSASTTPDDTMIWNITSAEDGYYYISSPSGYAIDIAGQKTANGTNADIYTNKAQDNQKFKFLINTDGTYTIVVKNSNDTACVEVANASLDDGANVGLWELNGATCQNWTLEEYTAPVTTVATTTAVQTTITTTTTVAVKTSASTEAQTTTTAVQTKNNDVTNITTSDTDATTAKSTTVTTVTSVSTVATGNTSTTSESSSTTTTTTTTTTPDSTLMYGDVNVDGAVTISDAVLFNKFLVSSASLSDLQKKNADTYFDNNLDSKDSLSILKFLVQTIEELPIIPES